MDQNSDPWMFFLLVLTYPPALSLSSYQGCQTLLLCNVSTAKEVHHLFNNSEADLFCCGSEERIASISMMKCFYFFYFYLQVDPFIFQGHGYWHSRGALLMKRPSQTKNPFKRQQISIKGNTVTYSIQLSNFVW